MFRKYAPNFQEDTHAEVRFQYKATLLKSHLQSNFIEITLRDGCSLVDLLYIFITPFYIRTPLEGYFCYQ